MLSWRKTEILPAISKGTKMTEPTQPAPSLSLGQKIIGSDQAIICVPLVAKQPAEAVAQLKRLAAAQPDLIEIRLDYFEDLTAPAAASLLTELHQACSIPLLATFRRHQEGGARPLSEPERLAILQAALESGAIRLLDVELQTSPAARTALLTAARQRGIPTIISYHDFDATPPYHALLATLKELAATGADIVKLAVYPRVPLDTLNLLAATHEATTTFLDRPAITMAMGALGSFTRLAGPFFGSAMSFAVGEQTSAPGQLGIDIMREVWNNWNVR
jgi:3-dehydroquinate dehydratase I